MNRNHNEKVIKQYTISEAYTGNNKITRYENGKEIGYDIVSWSEEEGYISALESLGYEEVYDVSFYDKQVREAEEILARAKELYELALKHPLYINNKNEQYNKSSI